MYFKETFPPSVKFVKDNPVNRKILFDKLGESLLCFPEYTYIEVNTHDKTWRTCMAFEWLYRDKPPLIEIKDILLNDA